MTVLRAGTDVSGRRHETLKRRNIPGTGYDRLSLEHGMGRTECAGHTGGHDYAVCTLPILVRAIAVSASDRQDVTQPDWFGRLPFFVEKGEKQRADSRCEPL